MILDEQFCSFDQATGTLVVDLRIIHGSESGLIRIRPWQDHVLIEFQSSSGWLQDDTIFDYPVVSDEVDELSQSHPLRLFSSALPGWVRKIIRPFRANQLRLLRVLSIYPLSSELALKDPIRFFLLPECLSPQSDSDEIVNLCKKTKREILQLVFGDGSKSLQKFLSKIYNFSFDHIDLDILYSFFKTPEWSILRHLPCMNWQILKISVRDKTWFEYKGVRSQLNSSRDAEFVSHLKNWRSQVADIVQMTRVLNLPDPTSNLKKADNLASICRMHDSLVDRLNDIRRLEVEGRHRAPFPLPPIPGNNYIHPIQTFRELLDEGTAMHHCVGSYVDGVLDGRRYIYKILAPQRATLEILITPDGKCRLGQLKLACNAKPAIETSVRIREWIESWKQYLK